MNMHFFLSGIYHGLLILLAIIFTVIAMKRVKGDEK
jgi:hypothetical protein